MDPSHNLLLAELARILRRGGAPYMVIGGQAVLVHGEPRLTKDIDLTLAISPLDVQRVIDLLQPRGIVPAVEDPVEFVRKTHVLPSQSTRTHLRVDMSFTDSPYELAAIARGVDVVLDGEPVRFASAEDLVIHKIIAGRPVDHQDVEGILLKNPDIDATDIRQWLARFAEALDQPLVEAFDELWRATRD